MYSPAATWPGNSLTAESRHGQLPRTSPPRDRAVFVPADIFEE